jgi:hypothetical protein
MIKYNSMSIQSVVPFEINGETLYTHTSWFSERQYNAWFNIPRENKNLALYFSLSAFGVAAIVTQLPLSSSEGRPSSGPSRPATVKFSQGAREPSEEGTWASSLC